MPSPKRVFDLKSLARAHTEMALRTVCGLAKNATSEGVKLQACAVLLERGWGRPAAAGHRRGWRGRDQDHHPQRHRGTAAGVGERAGDRAPRRGEKRLTISMGPKVPQLFVKDVVYEQPAENKDE